MQPNTITLAVDVLNNATHVNQEFVRLTETVGKSTYRGPDNTASSRNQLSFYASLPKRSGNFLGSSKASVKTTLDIAVPNADGSGNLVAPAIAEVSFSLPVGTTPAQALAIRQCLIAVLDRDDLMVPLCTFGEI